jgi:hypothetical protein
VQFQLHIDAKQAVSGHDYDFAGLALLHLSESRTVSDRDTPLVRVALGHGGTTTVLQISRIRPHYPRAADISRWLLL